MTRRDYVMLSTALRRAYVNAAPGEMRHGVELSTGHIAHDLAIQSGGFDTARFLSDVMTGGANVG